MEGFINCLVESMFRFIGQTVTIFTTSGGLSGNGFTGVLLSVDCNCVRLLADIGAYRIIITPEFIKWKNQFAKSVFYSPMKIYLQVYFIAGDKLQHLELTAGSFT